MIGIGKHTKRFDLLYLEEGEQYIKDFTGTVKFYNVLSNSYK